MPIKTIDANTLKNWLDNGEAMLVDVPKQRKKLVDIAAKCPLQRTLQSDLVIRTL